MADRSVGLVATDDRDLVAVSLGSQLPGQPFPSVDADPFVVRLQLLVVRDIDDVVGQAISLRLTGSRVLVRERRDQTEPFEYRRLGRHLIVAADRAEAFAIGQAFADRVRHGLVELKRPWHPGPSA